MPVSDQGESTKMISVVELHNPQTADVPNCKLGEKPDSCEYVPLNAIRSFEDVTKIIEKLVRENMELRDRVDELQRTTENAQLKDKVTKLRAQKREIWKQFNVVQGKYEDLEQDISKLVQEAADLKQGKMQIQQTLANVEAKFKEDAEFLLSELLEAKSEFEKTDSMRNLEDIAGGTLMGLLTGKDNVQQRMNDLQATLESDPRRTTEVNGEIALLKKEIKEIFKGNKNMKVEIKRACGESKVIQRMQAKFDQFIDNVQRTGLEVLRNPLKKIFMIMRSVKEEETKINNFKWSLIQGSVALDSELRLMFAELDNLDLIIPAMWRPAVQKQ